MAFDLAARCPRLARAHRQRLAELADEYEARQRARRIHQSALWAVAHRELQLVRAEATGKGHYIRERQRKLSEARRRLVVAEKWLVRVSA